MFLILNFPRFFPSALSVSSEFCRYQNGSSLKNRSIRFFVAMKGSRDCLLFVSMLAMLSEAALSSTRGSDAITQSTTRASDNRDGELPMCGDETISSSGGLSLIEEAGKTCTQKGDLDKTVANETGHVRSEAQRRTNASEMPVLF